MGTSSHIKSHLPHPLHRTHYRQLYLYLFKLQPNSLGLQGNLCSACVLSYEFQHLLGLQECHELQGKGSRLYNSVIPPSPENKQVFSVHENVWVEAGQVIVNSLLAALQNLSSLHTILVSTTCPSSFHLPWHCFLFMEFLSSDMVKPNSSSSPPNLTFHMIYCCYSWATQSWRHLTGVYEPEKSLSN